MKTTIGVTIHTYLCTPPTGLPLTSHDSYSNPAIRIIAHYIPLFREDFDTGVLSPTHNIPMRAATHFNPPPLPLWWWTPRNTPAKGKATKALKDKELEELHLLKLPICTRHVSEGLAHCLSLNLDPMKEILKHVFNIKVSNMRKPRAIKLLTQALILNPSN